MSDADTKRAIKAYAFDKIEALVIECKYRQIPVEDIENVLDAAKAQMQVIDEQAKTRNR